MFEPCMNHILYFVYASYKCETGHKNMHDNKICLDQLISSRGVTVDKASHIVNDLL
jgi:hypothetical protein